VAKIKFFFQKRNQRLLGLRYIVKTKIIIMNDKTDNICSISKFTGKSCFIMALMIFCGHKKDKVNL